MSYEIELFACTNKLLCSCVFVCVCVCVFPKCFCVCNVVSRREGGYVACMELREIKNVYEILGLPQRASDSHNLVQYYYRGAIFTKLHGLHQHFVRHTRWHVITLESLMLIVLVFSVGAHHSLVHRLSVPDPGFIPGLLCGKRDKWGVWYICWCSLVGTGKTKLTLKQETWRFCIHFPKDLQPLPHLLYYVMSLFYLFTRSLSPPSVMVIRFPRPGMDVYWQPHSAWSGWPSLHSLLWV